MKKLILVKPDLELPDKIAIVGSSARLLHAGYGYEIDQHDCVVRFNRAITEGFEGDSGFKTSVRVVNLHALQCKPFWRGDKLQPHQDLVKTLRDTKLIADCFPDIFMKSAPTIHESVQLYHSNRWTQQHLLKYTLKEHLSLGVFFVSLCVESGFTPNCYGFDFNEGEKRFHYWWQRDPTVHCHDVNQEMKLLRQMRDDGKIILNP